MGRKPRPRNADGTAPRSGLRRSIRHGAHEPGRGRSGDALGGDRLDDPLAALRRPRVRAADAPPTIQLRRLRAEAALERLELMLGVHRRHGQMQVLVVHGRGHNSPGGQPVLGPLVRRWLDEHPQLVASWREAPPAWGGEGAVVIDLRPSR
jgi:DNA-nicking Smr family endonuclease